MRTLTIQKSWPAVFWKWGYENEDMASSDRCFENLPSVTRDARMRRLYLHELEWCNKGSRWQHRRVIGDFGFELGLLAPRLFSKFVKFLCILNFWCLLDWFDRIRTWYKNEFTFKVNLSQPKIMIFGKVIFSFSFYNMNSESVNYTVLGQDSCFLATLVALHFTPVSKSVSEWVGRVSD